MKKSTVLASWVAAWFGGIMTTAFFPENYFLLGLPPVLVGLLVGVKTINYIGRGIGLD